MPIQSESIKSQITTIALSILSGHPEGMQYSELMRAISEQDPSLARNTIHGTVWDLQEKQTAVYRPAPGLYRLTRYREEETDESVRSTISEADKKRKPLESEFYSPFADWLLGEQICTRARSLGGGGVRMKWATPDVIGIREWKEPHIIRADTEVISAEIKTDPNELITAFGQACAYSLFSHKTYLAIPSSSRKEDVRRLEGLCQSFGIGLVQFNENDPDKPGFSIRNLAQHRQPDLHWTNEFLQNKTVYETLYNSRIDGH